MLTLHSLWMYVIRQATEGRRASDCRTVSIFTLTAIRASPTTLQNRLVRVAQTEPRIQSPGLFTARAVPDTPPIHGAKRPSSSHSNEDSGKGVPTSPAGSSPSLWQSENSSSASESSKHWLFQRAANLLRQSLDQEGDGGVMYMGTNEYSSGNFPDSHRGFEDFKSPAPVLALSTCADPLSNSSLSPVTNAAVNLDHGFLDQLTHRYPKADFGPFTMMRPPPLEMKINR
ncbi:hypothetical protein N7456_006787 [Penicillium angulare]|uniref:Uncharacterized protein n=1 Tax=Penicillium angulare TaxID=116970 RepID=A0A9W9FIG2_9EURO|nr:hypothetical protein N7456_006787 [Penicillium angulare]